MPHPQSEGGKQLRALADQVSARGLYRSDLTKAHALLNIAFAGEDDEKALNKQVLAIVDALPDDTPSTFVDACKQFADLVDEIAARWEAEWS